MLRLQNISVMRGVRTLYSDATLITSPGERIGLVGPNGSGKSTLFSAILGEISCENGELKTPDVERIAHVAQRITETDAEALNFVLEGHHPYIQAKADLEKAKQSSDDMQLAYALSHLAEINEGAVIAQAESIMHGLGFKPGDEKRKVSEFSGGWRNRLALARALMRPADLLLLDEPTNHLDLDSVIWLENWLRHLQSTIIVISHDREFLDRISQTIWSIEDGTIRRYSGNYSDFERLRAERIKLQEAAAKAYERTSAHLQSYIDRFRYKATKARQAQARIKMLEKLQAVEPIRAASEWRFRFPDPEKVPQNLILAKNLSCGYPGNVVLKNVKAEITAGDRIGVLGVNGAGKSTLIKTLIGILPKLDGEIRYGQGTEIGYFAQHQLDDLRDDETPLQHLARIAPPDTREQELRNFLGGFKFTGDMALSKVGPMSGGEKARLSLALIAWKKPNLLVLDEPTNHLDMQTREALTVALSSYEGAVLLVSHDRHLLKASCDKLWLVHDHELSEFDGDLDDYAAFVLNDKKEKETASTPQAADAPVVNKKEQRKIQAQERQRIAQLVKPLKKEIEKIEKKISQLEEKKTALDAKIADPSFYENASDEVGKVVEERGLVQSELDELESEWLEISEKIEQIQSVG